MGYQELLEKYQNLDTSELYDIMWHSKDWDVIMVCSDIIEARELWEDGLV